MASSQLSPTNPKLPVMWHGADYNPEQWAHINGTFEQDMRLMRLARMTTASVGIFSWAELEPEEGRFSFDWLDRVLDGMLKNGVHAVLATPTGAKPNWLALKYEEVRRINREGHREAQQGRHNHCPTSPIYREKTRIINTKLAERYAHHPAVVLWHLSNEYGGYCYCDLCFAAFRTWLQAKYKTIDALNQAYWSKFWSHTYRSFDQITHIDYSVHGLQIDWRRFMTDQTTDFMRHEIEPLKKANPAIPVTTNMMGTYIELNYWKMAAHLDVISWDSYPTWHSSDGDFKVGADTAFIHDMNRAMKGGQPWLLMESTPSQTNWQGVSRLKRPGMHRLSSLQAVAHGSDSVMYFQWRKSRGSCEKFHGAVVDHVGHENTRVFREVAQVGIDLEKLKALVGARTDAQTAVVFDWENHWAIHHEAGPRNTQKEYDATVRAHYRSLYRQGVSIDVIEQTVDLSKYRLVVAPMSYMLRPGFAERVRSFVQNGGTIVMTYMSGQVDENDLCFLGGWPGGGLMDVFGIWIEETDAFDEDMTQSIQINERALGLSGTYACGTYADIVHLRGARAIGTYTDQFYAGSPVVTLNQYGQGKAIFVASRAEQRFNDDLMAGLVKELNVPRLVKTDLPEGVVVTERSTGTDRYLFAMNFSDKGQRLDIGPGENVLEGGQVSGAIDLPAYGVAVVKRKS